MVANAKAAVPTVGDNAVAMQLSTTAQNTAMALIELKNAAGKVMIMILEKHSRKNLKKQISPLRTTITMAGN